MGELGHGRLKFGHVAPHLIPVQPQTVAADVEWAVADGRLQRRQRAAQRGAGVAVVHLRPEQSGQRVARMKAGGDGQVGQQGGGLARVRLQYLAVPL
jgi:hypothetical protein